MKEIKLQDNPEVSIVVPMYNSEHFVATTLNSLINQSFKNIEIIVVDDGSTDKSKKIVDHFSYDRRLRYFHKENGGTGSALNFGHERARGKYVTWCSADNIYYPLFIEVLLEAIKAKSAENPRVQLVYSDFHFLRADGQPIKPVIHNRPQTGADLIEGYDVGMSFLYTKELWDKTGPYWDRICEDFHWVVRAAQHAEFGLVNAVLAGFRVHGGQITGSRQEEEKAAADECKTLARELFGEVSKAALAAELSEKLGL
jgi:glycosyltransferase involved in cell wall biosynthesis